MAKEPSMRRDRRACRKDDEGYEGETRGRTIRSRIALGYVVFALAYIIVGLARMGYEPRPELFWFMAYVGWLPINFGSMVVAIAYIFWPFSRNAPTRMYYHGIGHPFR